MNAISFDACAVITICLKNPSDDLKSILKLCTDFLIQATEQDNEVDLHMAHTLTQITHTSVSL